MSNPWVSPISGNSAQQYSKTGEDEQMAQFGCPLNSPLETFYEDPCQDLSDSNPFVPSADYVHSLSGSKSNFPGGSASCGSQDKIAKEKARMPDFLKHHARSRRSMKEAEDMNDLTLGTRDILDGRLPITSCDQNHQKLPSGHDAATDINPFSPAMYRALKSAQPSYQSSERVTEREPDLPEEVGGPAALGGSNRSSHHTIRPSQLSQSQTLTTKTSPVESSGHSPWTEVVHIHRAGIPPGARSPTRAEESFVHQQGLSSPPASPGFPASLFVTRRPIVKGKVHHDPRGGTSSLNLSASDGGALSKEVHLQGSDLNTRSISQPGGTAEDDIRADQHQDCKGMPGNLGEQMESSSLYQLD